MLFTLLRCAIDVITSIIMLKSVIDEIQAGKNYLNIVFLVVGLFLFQIITKAVMSIYETFYLPKADIEINRRFQKMFYNKTFELELACFERNEFYDRFIRANTALATKSQACLLYTSRCV